MKTIETFNISLATKPLIMKLKFLWLREKIYYKFFAQKENRFNDLCDRANIEFVPQIYLQLMPTDTAHKQIAFCGFYELAASNYIFQQAKVGGLMIDVGANYGYYSCLWAGANTLNKVIAFEASPQNIAPLQKNIVNNKLEYRVKIHELALGKEVGSLPFSFMSDRQTGWGGLTLEKQINTVEVPVITLDRYMKDNYPEQIINLLKIDTEGADTWVLKGAKNLLKEHKIKHILFEENIVRMTSLGIETGEAQKLLKKYNYKVKKLTKSEWYACII